MMKVSIGILRQIISLGLKIIPCNYLVFTDLRSNLAQIKIHDRWSIDAGVRRTFLDKTLNLGLRIRDIFGSLRFAIDSYREGYIAYQEWNWKPTKDRIFSKLQFWKFENEEEEKRV